MKFCYSSNHGLGDHPLYDKGRAVHGTCPGSRAIETSSCTSCLVPFQVLDFLGKSVDKLSPDICESIAHAKSRLLIYMTNIQPALNQDKKSTEVMYILLNGVAENALLIIIDYKIKFEPVRFRETSSKFYNRSCMSLHGSVLFYRPYHCEWALDDTPPVANISEQCTMVIDHVVNN